MIKRPGIIVLKSLVCAGLMGMIVFLVHFTVTDVWSTAEYASVEARLLRLEQLCSKGEFDRLRENFTYYNQIYDEAYDPMWEISKAYDCLCDYEMYAYGLEHPSEHIESEVWRGYAMDMQQRYHEEITDLYEASTFGENEKVLRYFVEQTEK